MLAARVPPLRKIGEVLPALEINDSLQLLSALQWQYMQESMQACSVYAANVEHLRVCSGDAEAPTASYCICTADSAVYAVNAVNAGLQ